MDTKGPLLPRKNPVPLVSREEQAPPQADVIATRDHEVIKRWAERHSAQPATGEATSSGPGTVDVKDDGAGIRFNFPGVSRFRRITWDEWLEHFDRHGLTFVYERDASLTSARYRIIHAEEWDGRIREV